MDNVIDFKKKKAQLTSADPEAFVSADDVEDLELELLVIEFLDDLGEIELGEDDGYITIAVEEFEEVPFDGEDLIGDLVYIDEDDYHSFD